ncbi:MAG: MOMP family protein [Simkaniaceae bacterium]|nr:MOMP family protein [Simkaniaceae bacterium]
MKRCFFTIICLFVFHNASYALFESPKLEELEAQVQKLELQVAKLSSINALETEGITATSANPKIYGKQVFIHADLLYFHPKVSGTEFAYSNRSQTSSLPLMGRIKKMDFDWDFGFRFGVGKNFHHDEWDLYLAYTRFHSSGSKSVSSGCADSTIPLKGGIVTANTVKSARSQFSFKYDNIDLELGRHFFLSSKLGIRPFIAVKNAWLDQGQLVRYTGGEYLMANTVHIKDECDFWGIGPRAGVTTRWHLGDHFHIHGMIDGALLYGFFDVDHRERLSNNCYVSIDIEDNKHQFSPTAHMQFGLDWGRYINTKENYINLSVSYEAEYLFRQNQMLRTYEYSSHRFESISEDVSMHGVTFSAQLYF